MSLKAIYNGTILTMDNSKKIIENGVVVVEDDLIKCIGDKNLISQYTFDEKIDAKGGIIMPGFINGHTHISMSIFRSLGEDVKDRLTRYLFPMEDLLVDEELVYAGAKLSLAETILGGVTTIADMYYFEDVVATAIKEMGVRAIVGETIINKPAPGSVKPYGAMELSVELIEKWKNDTLITPAFAPHAPYTTDEKILSQIKELAYKYDVPIMMHISEMPWENPMYKEKYNLSTIGYLSKIGFLCDHLVGAHMIFVDDDDMTLLSENKVGVIHCVSGNAKSGRPVSPVPKMLEKGISVGFGTDGPMSGNHQDIQNILHMYTKIQKLNAQDNTICPSIEAVELGTMGGAKALKMDKKIGSLEVGKKADIIIIDTNAPNIQPIYDYYSAITYAAYPHNVMMTMVNGKVLMKDRKLLYGDVEQIIHECKKYREIVLKAVEKM